MSPGFPKIFAGIILVLIGTVILANPLTKIRYDIRKNPMLVIMVLPSILYFLITSYLPMVGVYFAFTSYQFTTDFFSTLFGSKFVGLSNFEYLFSSGLAWRMTANTIIYNFIFIVGGTILKVAVAIMFSEISGRFYKKYVQTITFLPHFISMVMVGTFAYNLLNYNSGVINSLMTALGFDRVDFYSMPGAWYVILPLVDFWKGVGYGSIIYVSAITGISDDLYEAADLDGASFMQEIIHITLPSLRPTIVILTLMSLGSIMKGNFDLFYQLVGESDQLMETTEIIDTYVWRSLRQGVQIGMGSAAGLYQSFVGMILVVLVNAIVKKIEPDYFNQGVVSLSYNGLNVDKFSGTVGTVHSDHPDWKIGFVPYGLKQGYVFNSSTTQDATAIPITAEHPELALKVIELIYTDKDLMQLISYGIQDMHYTLDENGAYVATDAASNYGQYAMNTWPTSSWTVRPPRKARLWTR